MDGRISIICSDELSDAEKDKECRLDCSGSLNSLISHSETMKLNYRISSFSC